MTLNIKVKCSSRAQRVEGGAGRSEQSQDKPSQGAPDHVTATTHCSSVLQLHLTVGN